MRPSTAKQITRIYLIWSRKDWIYYTTDTLNSALIIGLMRITLSRNWFYLLDNRFTFHYKRFHLGYKTITYLFGHQLLNCLYTTEIVTVTKIYIQWEECNKILTWPSEKLSELLLLVYYKTEDISHKLFYKIYLRSFYIPSKLYKEVTNMLEDPGVLFFS